MWDVIKRNPVRVRAVLVAVLVAAGWFAPDVLDAGTQETVVGVVMTGLALVFGWDASNRVTLRTDPEDAGEAEATEFLDAMEYERNKDEGYRGRRRM